MMSIKDAALEHAAAIENQLIQIRADQIEQGQQLTERINGVANQVKAIDAKVTRLETRIDRLETRMDGLETRMDGLETRMDKLEGRFDVLESKVDGMQQTQTEMLSILIGIQRKLEAA